MIEYIIYGVLMIIVGLLMIKNVEGLSKLSWAARHGVDKNGLGQVQLSIVLLGMFLTLIGVVITIVSIFNL